MPTTIDVRSKSYNNQSLYSRATQNSGQATPMGGLRSKNQKKKAGGGGGGNNNDDAADVPDVQNVNIVKIKDIKKPRIFHEHFFQKKVFL